MKKIIVLMVLLVSFSISLIFFKHGTNELSTNEITETKEKNEKITVEEIEDVDEHDEEEKEVTSEIVLNESQQEKQKSYNNNNTQTKENASTSTSSSGIDQSQNNSQSSTEQNTQNSQTNQSADTIDGNAVNKNTLDYSTHKGRIEKNCESNNECTEQGLNFYLRYKRVVASFSVLDVTANNGKILGYFIQYEFKEGEYNTETECKTVGTAIKSELSDRVTKFMCSSRNDKFYLNITTDYD